VTSPTVAVTVVSSDNVEVKYVALRERRSGQVYEPLKGGVIESTIELPQVEMPDGKEGAVPTPTAGGFAVRWIGRADRRYRLYRQLSLLPGSPTEEVTNVVPQGGTAPWYVVPVEIEVPAAHPAAWYRVTVDRE